MPVAWTAEADAKMMAAIMTVANIRLNAEQMNAVAVLMGPGCTAKAISHRLTKLRKLAAEGDDDGAPKTKKPRTSRGKQVTQPGTAGADDDNDEDESPTPAPPTEKTKLGGKGAVPKAMKDKRTHSQMAGRGGVKLEPQDDGIAVGEDIGEGLRSSGGSGEGGRYKLEYD